MIRRHTTALTLAASLLVAACGGKSDAEQLAEARAALDKHDHRAASIVLKSLLQKNDKLAEARYLLGRSLLEQGSATAAAVELGKAADLGFDATTVSPLLAKAMLAKGEYGPLTGRFAGVTLPDPAAQADLLVSMATAHLARNEKDEGQAAVNEALRTVPQYPPALLLNARLLADQQRNDDAKALVEQVLAANPKSSEAWMLKGELAMVVDKDRKAAIAAYRQAIAADPKQLNAHVAAVSALMLDGDAAGATAQVADMKKHFGQHPRTRFFEAELACNAKDYKGARELMRPVVQALPNSPQVLQLAGAVEFRLGNMAQAETYLASALKATPGLPLAMTLLSQVYLRTGQPQRTLDTLKPALDGRPGPSALQLAAEAHLQLGDAAKAEQLYQQAAKLKPDDPRIRTALALSQFSKGKTDSAINELEHIAASDSGALADLALISAHLRKREADKALKAIDALEKKQPDKPLAPMLRGRVLALKQDLAGARAQFTKALQIDKQYFPAAAGLASLDMAAGQPAEARKHFDELLKANPDSSQAMQALASLLARSGNTGDEVAKLLAGAVKKNPGDVRAQVSYINFLIERRDAKQAITVAREAAQAVGDQPDVVLALGRAYLAANDAQQAITTFNKLAQLQPKSPQPLLGLADAQLMLKDSTSASRSLKRALELAPGLLQARRGLVSIALADKQPSEAMTLAKAVQKDLPEQAVGHVLEGDVETWRQNPKAALVAYQAGLKKRAPEEAAARTHGTLVALGQTAEAEQFAQRWLDEHPRDTVFPFYLGDRALADRNYAAAEARYRKVAELQPQNALALNNVAWLMLQQGKAGALPFAEKANQLLPGRPPLMDTLASALAAEKQLTRAVDIQKQAVERAPDDGSLRVNLAKLYLQVDQKGMARTELQKVEQMGRKYPNQDEVAKLLKAL